MAEGSVVGGDSTTGMTPSTPSSPSSFLIAVVIPSSPSSPFTTEDSDSSADAASSSTSIFLRLPLGAGSSGVRQYVTVRVTTCRTLTLPGLPLASTSTSRGEKDALQGAAERGVEE